MDPAVVLASGGEAASPFEKLDRIRPDHKSCTCHRRRRLTRRPRVSLSRTTGAEIGIGEARLRARAEPRPIDNGWPPTDVKSYHIELFNPYKAVWHLNQFACRSD